jgi:DNA-binding NtrC family response regulator
VTNKKLLLVDDEASIRFSVGDYLERCGFAIEEADSVVSAVARFRSAHPDLVVLDYELPDGNALEIMEQLRQHDESVPVIILTGHGSINLAVTAIKLGADQFLTKPVELAALRLVIERALDNARNRKRQRAANVCVRSAVLPFAGESDAIRRLRETCERVVDAQRPILILGETGSGKGVLSAWLHANSARRDEPFVDLNCAGLARDFLESELFGHERGAFTGAVAMKHGLFEVAHKGTLFLDEIGDVDPTVQPKLLKVLEERKFRRMGDVRDRSVDVQLLAATHQDLPELVRTGRFRSDLYYRINTIPLRVPPLRERRADIALLAEQIARSFAREMGFPAPGFSRDAIRALENYDWPGNVRELKNAIERAMLLAGGGPIDAGSFRFESVAADYALPTVDSLEEVERLHIKRIIDAEGGRVESAAHRLGVPRSSLYQKLKKHRIAVPKSGKPV